MSAYDEIGNSLGLKPAKAGSRSYDDIEKDIIPPEPEPPKEKPKKGAVQDLIDKGSAMLSGFNRVLISRAGLPFNPVDVAANAIDLGKAAIGAPYIAATGKAPPSWLEAGDRSEVPGSGAWLLKQTGKTKIGREVISPNDPAYEGGYLQAAGSGLGNSPSNFISGPLAAMSSKAAKDATGSDALAVIAGMAPTAAKQGLVLAGQRVATPGDQRRAELAKDAVNRYGIPLSIADTTDSKFVKATANVMADTPLLGMIGGKGPQNKQEAFTRAVSGTFGANTAELTPAARTAAKANIGSKLDALWDRNAITVDAPLFQALQQARADAAKLPAGGRERVLGWVNDIESQMVPGPGNVPMIPGQVANRYQSTLGRQASTVTDGFVQESLAGLQKSLIGAFNRSIGPNDAGALSEARGQYKAFKTVDELMPKSDAGVAGRLSGDVPAGLLPGAVAQKYSGPSELGTLAQIGSQFLVNRTPQTGGSPRAMVQNGLLGGLAVGGTSLLNAPAAAGGAMTAAALQVILTNPKLAKYLLNADGTLKKGDLQTLINNAQKAEATQ